MLDIALYVLYIALPTQALPACPSHRILARLDSRLSCLSLQGIRIYGTAILVGSHSLAQDGLPVRSNSQLWNTVPKICT